MNRVSAGISLAVAMTAIAPPVLCHAQTEKGDVKQICIRMRGASYADVGCLITELSGHDAEATRAEAASALVRTIATANPPLDLLTAQRASDAVVKALRDRSVDVRVATVTALGEFGDDAMIPALQFVAKSDPVLSLRDYTAGAIARIRKRTSSSSFTADISAVR